MTEDDHRRAAATAALAELPTEGISRSRDAGSLVSTQLLAGDIGGTKTALALFEITATGPRRIKTATFRSGDYPSLESVVHDFGTDSSIDHACFAVAGPVEDGVARITNLPWIVDERALATALNIPVVEVINDLQATAFGMLFLTPADFAVICSNAGVVRPSTIAVIAPGTGLGEALLYWDGARYHAIASEGGHADFAAQTDDEIALFQYLRQRFGHVSYERVLSGDGIGRIYSFLREEGPAEPDWITQLLVAGDRNEAISEIALAERDPLCVEALDMFCAVLGAESANLALRGRASGGVIIGGGIAPKILPLLRRPPLLARFTRKGRFSEWLASLQIRVALDPEAALIGAAHWQLPKET
jgi:glucokinase